MRRSLGSLIALTLTVASAALPAGSSASTASTPKSIRALLTSKELWATIDVCNAPDQPNTLGIRSQMPGDGMAHDHMFMSFRLQYLEAATMRWIDLASSTTAFVAVGGSGSSRQGGRSFQLVPAAGKPAFMLRGVVDYQWRRAGHVLLSAARPTTAGHQSLAGADPAGFSAESCPIG
jgi:hypothetical protein